jgi:FAD/FMN-containing dehydrogenase
LKKDLLRVMYGPDGIEEMRKVRRLFDPEGVLNPGNLF